MGAVASTDIAEIERAIYDESFRAISEQAQVLDGLRGRATALAAVANVATAFVGGLVVTGDSGGRVALGPLEWSAIGLFCLGLALSIFVLMPSHGWVFWHQPKALLAVYVDPGPPRPLSEFRRTIAYYNGDHLERNARQIWWRTVVLWGATICLATEVIVWLVVLAT